MVLDDKQQYLASTPQMSEQQAQVAGFNRIPGSSAYAHRPLMQYRCHHFRTRDPKEVSAIDPQDSGLTLKLVRAYGEVEAVSASKTA